MNRWTDEPFLVRFAHRWEHWFDILRRLPKQEGTGKHRHGCRRPRGWRRTLNAHRKAERQARRYARLRSRGLKHHA